MKRKDLLTEKQNIASKKIDSCSTIDILNIINQQDRSIAENVSKILPQINDAVEIAVATIRKGNRIFYLGAGTSGRLGVLDAAEMPPTYSTPKDWFQGIIAGGKDALVRSIEGAEDQPEDAIRDLKNANLKKGDYLIGIASSGATPYVVSGLNYAKSIACKTAYIICNPKPLIPVDVDVLISVVVGPEIITGSTRMKSGTATKMVLNMISTATMIRLGKVYGNLMVDLQVVNDKLQDRAIRIIEQLTELSTEKASNALKDAKGSVKIALVMVLQKVSRTEAEKMMKKHNGNLRAVIGDIDD